MIPDGPKTPPFIQLLQWIADPVGLMERSAQKYGDCFTLRLGRYPTIVFLSNPQAIQEVFTVPEKFEIGEGNQILEPLLGEKSLVLMDGDRHKRQRRLLIPPFHGDRMISYGKIISEITEQVMSEWKIGEPFNVRSSMQDISLQVILQAVFGLHGGRFTQLSELLCSVLNLTGSPLNSSLLFFPSLQQDWGAWSPWGRFLRQKQQIERLLNAEIQERREHSDASRTDILNLLLSARDENGSPMTDEELRDELMTLLFAGHETTASALTWALYWIHHLPDVREKLLEELNSIGNDSNFLDIAKLPYLTAVCQETLRIYPVAMLTFSRIVKSPLQMMGYEFEPGIILSPCIYLTHRRPDLYSEPQQFKPERFLERQFSQYEYLPFGGSTRRCIGIAFAMLEMKLVLATVLSLELRIVNNHSVKPVRRNVTLSPSEGKWLVVNGKRLRVKMTPHSSLSLNH